jgi:hypothetical protein
MQIATLVLEYLKVVLSTPVICGIIFLILFCKFSAEFRNLINRISTVRFGGSEINVSQREREKEGLPENTEVPKPVGAPKLPETITLNQEQGKIISDVLQAERATAYLWEYRYLNFFLARRTQEALDWLASLPAPPTLHLADSFFVNLPLDERKAILDALKNHHLVDDANALLTVTPKGHEYLQWRGPLPPLVPVT